MSGPPNGYFVIVPPRTDEEAFDIGQIVTALGKGWKALVLTTLLGASAAAGLSFLMTPLYRSEALLMPAARKEASGRSGALSGQLGGLAALAGIDITAGTGGKEEAIATLSSSGFARDFINAEQLLPVLFERRWDTRAKRWKPGMPPPTLEDGVKKFTEEVRTISEDRTTGLITLKVEWRTPELAAHWANGMIDRVNERMRARAIRDAERSIDFLNKELEKTTVVELRQAIYRLIEEQVNNAMLANVQYEYAFRVVDPAVAPMKRASPRRAAMTVIGGVFGLFAGALGTLLFQRYRRSYAPRT
jgi:uncharacterized protein involved in exopolysaccharide biosynthesis